MKKKRKRRGRVGGEEAIYTPFLGGGRIKIGRWIKREWTD
jgi:hypothetical protein